MFKSFVNKYIIHILNNGNIIIKILFVFFSLGIMYAIASFLQRLMRVCDATFASYMAHSSGQL